MSAVILEIPDEIITTLNRNNDELSNDFKLYIALQLYKTHKLTLKQSADFAALSLEMFIKELSKNNIDVIDYSPEELDDELEIFKK